MTRIRKSLLAASLVAFLAVPAALAAGLWPTLPIVGGASFCGGFATGTTAQVCTTTVPAGPTVLTGAETIPADTNLAQGQAPSTVQVPVRLAASGAFNTSAPLTGASVVIPVGTTNYLIKPAGTIATLTVTMPASPYEGQVLRISSSQTVSALTLAGGTVPVTQTISNAPTAITLSTTGTYGYEFIYNSTVWYRLN